MRRGAALPGTAVLLLLAAPAHADWGKTQWGMTAEAVIAAVGPDARPIADDPDERVHDHRRLVQSSLRQDGIDYAVSYLFGKRGKGLTMVRLEPVRPADCAAMRRLHLAAFGTPEDRSTPNFMAGVDLDHLHWPTGPGKQVLELTEVRVGGAPRFCHVLFQERDFVKR